MSPGKIHDRLGSLVLAFAMAGGATALGCNGADIADVGEDPAATGGEEVATGTFYIAGDALLTDSQSDVALDLPTGWHALVPRLGKGSITIANYDLRNVENWMPEHSSHMFLDDMTKVDIATLELGKGRTVAEWVEARRSETSSSKSADGTVRTPMAVSDAIQYRLAAREGQAYTVHLGKIAALEIALPWESDRVLLATVLPADTEKLDEVLTVLDRVRPLLQEGAVPALTSRDELVAPIRTLVEESASLAPKAGCSSWTGSDSGSIAPSSPITLNLPFYYGTWWQSGGAGAFWGNLYHGNCYDDYYAIDFNRLGDSSCSWYADDSGQNVYASASGTAYTYSSSSGYGNRVDVYHSNGLMTRYAHLQSIAVSNGQSVGTQTVLGYVGSTGNSGGPHLHFGFYKNGVSRCNSSTGTCPNQEGSKSPQTPKPSPMYTNQGSKTMRDYGCYQAPP